MHASGGVIEGTPRLVAGGRTPDADGIGLETTGGTLRGHERGQGDERRRTTADGVWAVGDCAGGPYFTPISEDDFRVELADHTGGNRVRPAGAVRPVPRPGAA